MWRRITVMSIAFALTMTGTPFAKSKEAHPLRHSYTQHYQQVKHRFGKRAPGRNIVKYGVKTKQGTREATRPEIRESDGILDRMLHPPVIPVVTSPQVGASYSSTGAPVPSPGSFSGGGAPPDYIAQCESHGNPNAVSPGGTYRGKWQFDQKTWEGVGGQGDPAAAPESEQDSRAGTLYRQRGTAPWPVCG